METKFCEFCEVELTKEEILVAKADPEKRFICHDCREEWERIKKADLIA
jgi:hypothetical protein